MGNFKTKQNLTKEDLEFCKSHTRFHESLIKGWFKSFKKDCPSGKLTQAKVIDMLNTNFPNGKAEKISDFIFETFDIDKNGSIDFKELLLAIDIMSTKTIEGKLRSAFRLYDVDGNGSVDPGEMTKILLAMYQLKRANGFEIHDTPEERTRIIFSQIDNNGDGYITEDEFVKAFLKEDELSNLLTPPLL